MKRNKNIYMGMLLDRLGIDIKDIDPKKIIRTSQQFDEIFMADCKKDQVKHLSLEVDYDFRRKKYVLKVFVTNLSESRTVDVNDKQTVLIRDNGRICNKENYTWQSISVKLSQEVTARIGELVFGSNIVLVYNKYNGWVDAFVEKKLSNKTVYFDLKSGRDYDTLPSGNAYKVMSFALDPVTASGSRNRSGVFRNITDGDNRFEVFDKATCGGLTRLFKEVKHDISKIKDAKGFKSVKKAAKKAYGYVGNVATGSRSLGIVKAFHVYRGKWINITDESFLTDDFIDQMEEFNKLVMNNAPVDKINGVKASMDKIIEDNTKLEKAPTQDGQAYINCIELAVNIYESRGYLVDPVVLLGRMIQFRPATVKASGVVVSPFTYKMLIKGSEQLAETYGTKVDHFGEEDRSLFLADMNCIKLDFDMDKEFTFELLAFNKTSEGFSSKQMYKNILYAAQRQGRLNEYVELVRKLERLTIDEKFADAITIDKPAKKLNPDELLQCMESGFYTNAIRSIAPKFVGESKALTESNWKQVINSVVNSIDRMHGNINVESRRLASDPTFILTGGKLSGILNLGESFINDRRIRKSVMFKYPVAGMEEQYASINVSIKVIAKRVKKHVKEGTITSDEGEAIIQFFEDLQRTVRVLPPLMYLANACAGLDYDYDGESSIIYVEEPENRMQEISNMFVDILYNNGIRGVSIKIEEPKVTE